MRWPMSVDELLRRGLSIEEVWRRLGAANPQELGEAPGHQEEPKTGLPPSDSMLPNLSHVT